MTPPAFGKEQVTIGSAPDNDVVVPAPGVAPHHARIVKQNGQLFYIDLGAGPSTANDAPIAPQQPVPFDFRTVFAMGGVPVPLAHPALCSMIMSPGQLQVPRGQIVVGRDAARASLVIAHGAVSGQHATVMLDRMMAVDHGSTSGTYVGGQRSCRPNQPTPIDPNGVIAFGPVPVPVGLLVPDRAGRARGGAASRTRPRHGRRYDGSAGGGARSPPLQEAMRLRAPRASTAPSSAS